MDSVQYLYMKTVHKPQTTLGIITIATGKYYAQFMPNLQKSIEKWLDQAHFEVKLYCFTDTQIPLPGITHIATPHLAWPFSTLLRYQWIEKAWEALQDCDYLLYLDADMEIIAAIPNDIFLADLMAVRHPGYLKEAGAFEIDRKESTYLAPQLRQQYFQGCVWGGKKSAFHALVTTLAKLVRDDLQKGTIPTWHDESYLNFYLAQHPCKALPPTYAWPQHQARDGVVPYILHLEKSHAQIRETNKELLRLEAFLADASLEEQVQAYQQLYLMAHEKTQRLERRLTLEGGIFSKLRERLAYYKQRASQSHSD